MKTRFGLILALSVTFISATALFTANREEPIEENIDIVLQNIEALSWGETGGSTVCFDCLTFPSSIYDLTISVPACSPCGVHLSVVRAACSRSC